MAASGARRRTGRTGGGGGPTRSGRESGERSGSHARVMPPPPLPTCAQLCWSGGNAWCRCGQGHSFLLARLSRLRRGWWVGGSALKGECNVREGDGEEGEGEEEEEEGGETDEQQREEEEEEEEEEVVVEEDEEGEEEVVGLHDKEACTVASLSACSCTGSALARTLLLTPAGPHTASVRSSPMQDACSFFPPVAYPIAWPVACQPASLPDLRLPACQLAS